ncbi:NADH:flavin oxidoreductase/NADH oxidase [Limnohabitans radicicola]|uniref:NADH:flavin oxidoreductase/NADH oxidase n=1 Tax=Limnohabitans radicicola TaxID=2771427 RepID=A0A927FJG4_9BURK|nr:NADH:flavin oxidoreductase/NADH oxidase [Limnohabitans radicicola]MBD8051602.1 NADH:flavin oxidoreductase/NADH oxidase [Limnohabitans radicicola]
MSLLFTPFTFDAPRGPLTLPNRIVIAPMCQYSALDGQANDWHLTHWTNLLNSGAGMLTIEATAVSPEGRISPGCLGLWDDATAEALSNNLQRARRLAPAMPVCLQVSHAGRKASSAAPWDGGMLITPQNGGWQPLAPSALPHLPQEAPPSAMSLADIEKVKKDFVYTAQRAQVMGIEAIELHAAHGYLLHQFLSPLSNQRTDAYGGSFENRIRFVMEVFQAVREVFDGTLGIRISGTDWVDGGWTIDETCELAQHVKQAGAQFVHISSGGVSPLQKITLGPEYQVPLAKAVKERSGLTTFAVGLITEPTQAEAVLQRGDADLVALARSFMYKPRWGWEAAVALDGTVNAQHQYWRSLPREAKNIFADAKIGMR